MNTLRHNYRYLLTAIALTCAFTTAQAKDLYRVIEPNGLISYTDSPKPGANASLIDTFTGAPKQNMSDVDLALLPGKLRSLYSSYPVVLFTTTGCAGCPDAKSFLSGRGIPYIEYTVNTAEDATEFKNQTSTSGFPTLKVGNKALPGFNSKDWETYLNAAGYPAKSELPSSYTNPLPRPLTKPTDAPVVSPESPPTISFPTRAPTPSDTTDRDNPAGIRF